MGKGVNMFANKQNGSNPGLRKGWDKVNWGPGHIERDEFGFPIKPSQDSKNIKETQHADIQK